MMPAGSKLDFHTSPLFNQAPTGCRDNFTRIVAEFPVSSGLLYLLQIRSEGSWFTNSLMFPIIRVDLLLADIYVNS